MKPKRLQLPGVNQRRSSRLEEGRLSTCLSFGFRALILFRQLPQTAFDMSFNGVSGVEFRAPILL
jgi:hypothetical protein